MKEDDDFKIGGVPVSEIIAIASRLVAATPDIPGNEDPKRQGGYLVIRQKHGGTPVLIERIGKCRTANVNLYHNLALEKGERLSNTRLTSEHVSSYQSRDTQNNEWGGAIIAGDFIVSFSGLKELFDEAVVLALALRLNWLSHGEISLITEVSGNTFVKPLYNLAAERENQ